MTRVYLICTVIFLALVSSGATVSGENKPASVTIQGPLSPQESLRHLRVAPGLRVELVAAEPQIIDPVAIAFDERGRLWVVEMSDYPRGPGPNEAPKSRVRSLLGSQAGWRWPDTEPARTKLRRKHDAAPTPLGLPFVMRVIL